MSQVQIILSVLPISIMKKSAKTRHCSFVVPVKSFQEVSTHSKTDNG